MRTFRIYSLSNFHMYYIAVVTTVAVLDIQVQYKLAGGLCSWQSLWGSGSWDTTISTQGGGSADDHTLALKYICPELTWVLWAELSSNKETHMATINIQRADKFNILVCQEGEENWKY